MYVPRPDPICLNCAYSLRGIPANAACPECGASVRLSLQQHLSTLATRVNVRFLLIAAILCLVRDLTWIAGSLMPSSISGLFVIAGLTLGFPLEIAVHILLFSAQPKPGQAYPVPYGQASWLLMALALLATVLTAILAVTLFAPLFFLAAVSTLIYLCARTATWVFAMDHARLHPGPKPLQTPLWAWAILLTIALPTAAISGFFLIALNLVPSLPGEQTVVILSFTLSILGSLCTIIPAARFLTANSAPTTPIP